MRKRKVTGINIRTFNKQRRKEIANKKRAVYHRSEAQLAVGDYKVLHARTEW